MRTVTVENNKIVVEVDGAKVRYPLEIVRKRIASLLQDLEEWRKYERLLTQRALDEAPCSAKYHEALAEKGDTVCGVCGSTLRQ
jgi:hypothetical protein